MIAVVDDDEGVRRAVVRLLRAAGFSARGFATGQELLEAWLIEPPTCVVMELQLKGDSGLQVQSQLHYAGARVPTIFITASDDARARAQCVGEGGLACLRKPVDARALLTELQRAGILPDLRSSQTAGAAAALAVPPAKRP
jgi:FixJ family two-component response regulator